MVADTNTLEAFHADGLMSPMQRCFSDLVCRRLFLSSHVARLDAGVPAHDALRLMVDTYQGRNPMASWRRPPGRYRNVWLNKIQEDANALMRPTLWRPEIVRGDGAERGSLGLRDDDDEG